MYYGIPLLIPIILIKEHKNHMRPKLKTAKTIMVKTQIIKSSLADSSTISHVSTSTRTSALAGFEFCPPLTPPRFFVPIVLPTSLCYACAF
ncbi:hypothetical protein ARMGADRAFT_775044 [Armillaria gallica]|uniref:Uncharacterized protein n=1 Tax=Armillaria gallica TaxID=47427 RepID=A0A2H3D2P1_ARMGA|nr:hypothetical protein ARMGADRAFT_775044 [Armillaria gallica]